MESTGHQKTNSGGEHAGKHHKKSSSELLSSAKVVAEAAKATVHHDSAKVDKGRVAGAAADLLEAASHYGKFEEKSFGKYVDKAENYLHHYHSSHAGSATHSEEETGGDSGFSRNDYLKMAQGFLGKH